MVTVTLSTVATNKNQYLQLTFKSGAKSRSHYPKLTLKHQSTKKVDTTQIKPTFYKTFRTIQRQIAQGTPKGVLLTSQIQFLIYFL